MSNQPNYRNRVIILILVLLLVKTIVSFSLNLGNDEVYYTLYAESLQINYFDHPPIVGWMIRFFTFNNHFNSEFFVRLGALISGSLSLWLIYLCGKKLNNEKTGYWAACIYSSTLYGSVITGIFILPDSPQMVCWIWSLYLLLQIVSDETFNRKSQIRLLLFGLSTGLGMLCKIHTVFLWFGFIFFILIFRRKWFSKYALYASALITFLLFTPIIYWEFENNFITYQFHSNRVNNISKGFDIQTITVFLFGLIFYTGIFLFPAYIKSMFWTINKKVNLFNSKLMILLFCSLPLLLVSFAISIFNTVLPHWPGPSFAGISLITAMYFQRKEAVRGIVVFPKILLFSLSFTTIVILSGTLLINFYPGTVGTKEKLKMGNGDFTLDMYGWEKISKPLDSIFKSELRLGLVKKDYCLISNKWFPASHIDFYIAKPLQLKMFVLGNLNEIHQYYFINKERGNISIGEDAYCIIPSNYQFNAKAEFSAMFKQIDSVTTIPQYRNGVICREFLLLRCKDYQGEIVEKNNFK